MKTEFEAKFLGVDVPPLRTQLRSLGARCVVSERLMQRIVFETDDLVKKKSWLRVRNEGDKTTMTLKQTTDAQDINRIREVEIAVDSFENAVTLLTEAGFKPMRHEDNKRESWRLGLVSIEIDTWPKIPTFVEVEGPNKESVETCVRKLGFDMNLARFGSIDEIYQTEYGIDIMSMPRLSFD